MKQSIERVMVLNCMLKAKQELVLSGRVTEELFRESVAEMARREEVNECRKINKSSSRTLEETIDSLKGRKKELYLKKAEKQAAYEERVRREEEEEGKGRDEGRQLRDR